MDTIEECLKRNIIIPELIIVELCNKVSEILIREDNIVKLNSPISICGDIHGQYYDLVELFTIGGKPPDTNYCFLGDYVDRGKNSIETIVYLFYLKVLYPSRITLLRGNHESKSMNINYGFYDECMYKYGSTNIVHKVVNTAFDYLPIAAILCDKLFLVHGGISPNIEDIHNIQLIDRHMDIPREGLMCDLLWSDPDENTDDWKKNERGCGYVFGHKQIEKFHHINNTDCVVRAHQLANRGYHYMFDQKLCTVWSAPNYCYKFDNLGCIMEIGENMYVTFNLFSESTSDPNRYVHNNDDTIYCSYAPASDYFS